MPRSKTILQSEFPYHVSARCINKEWFQLPMEVTWEIFSYQLCYISWVFKAQIHSFVLMNNHFHMLISTPHSNLSQIMAHFMKETSRRFNDHTGRINQTYGGRHYRCVIQNTHYYLHAYKYVYRNPVVAGLAEFCEKYPYSSLNFLLGINKATFPVIYDDTLFSDPEGTLKWINTESSDLNWKSIGKALHKSEFKIAKDRGLNKPNALEFVHL